MVLFPFFLGFCFFLITGLEDEMLLALSAVHLQTAERHPLLQLPRGRYAPRAGGRGEPRGAGARFSGRGAGEAAASRLLFVTGGGREGRRKARGASEALAENDFVYSCQCSLIY